MKFLIYRVPERNFYTMFTVQKCVIRKNPLLYKQQIFHFTQNLKHIITVLNQYYLRNYSSFKYFQKYEAVKKCFWFPITKLISRLCHNAFLRDLNSALTEHFYFNIYTNVYKPLLVFLNIIESLEAYILSAYIYMCFFFCTSLFFLRSNRYWINWRTTFE